MSCSLSKKAYASQTLYSKDKYRENRLKKTQTKQTFPLTRFYTTGQIKPVKKKKQTKNKLPKPLKNKKNP